MRIVNYCRPDHKRIPFYGQANIDIVEKPLA
jgi:hypothetical protein